MANDYLSTTIGFSDGEQGHYMLSGNLSFYAIPVSQLDSDYSKFDIPPVEEVIGVAYYPYLAMSDMNLLSGIIIDEKFCDSTYGYNIDKFESLNRVNSINSPVKVIQSGIDLTSLISDKSVGGTWKWQNESRLWCYPFHYIELTDGISSPIVLKMQNFSESFLQNTSIKIRHALNIQGIYQLIVNGYNGDGDGRFLSGEMTQGLPFPTSNNAYLNYLSNSQATLTANRVNRGMNVLGSALSLNPLSIVQSIGEGVLGEYNELMKQNDLMAQGYTVNNVGADVVYNVQQGFNLRFNMYGFHERQLQQIGLFFHQHGYAQNKLMVQPNTKSRKNFNYIKASNVVLIGSGVPKFACEQIKGILSQGVTIWHTETSGNFIGNYLPDNTEI